MGHFYKGRVDPKKKEHHGSSHHCCEEKKHHSCEEKKHHSCEEKKHHSCEEKKHHSCESESESERCLPKPCCFNKKPEIIPGDISIATGTLSEGTESSNNSGTSNPYASFSVCLSGQGTTPPVVGPNVVVVAVDDDGNLYYEGLSLNSSTTMVCPGIFTPVSINILSRDLQPLMQRLIPLRPLEEPILWLRI